MSIARHHAEWLSLVPVSGPFLSLPVLMEAFNTGLEPHDPEHVRLLRQEYEAWRVASDEWRAKTPERHYAFIRFVLQQTLDLPSKLLLEGQAIPQTLQVELPEHGEFLRPTFALINPADAVASSTGHSPLATHHSIRLLVQTYPRSQELTSYVAGSPWKASPDTRMTELLHGTGVRLGLVTNGEHWMLVDAPKGETTGYASWYASLWIEEYITLRAFRSLLSASRFFNVPDDQTLEALLAKSASNQQEVTDQLGYQVRRAVEVLIHSLDRADQDFGRELLADVSPEQLYESALTVMMRLVFLFCAEERELIPSKPFPVYEQNYSVSTISKQLRELADQHGEELLERRYDAWPRLLAAFRAVYGGLKHDDVHIPAYGGNLFNPDRFPFLEGRKRGTSWKDSEANPLPVNNRTVLHLLEALQLLQIKVPGGGPAEARRLSFRALDIEQIGHVYEGLLDHTAKRAAEPFLGLAGTRDKEPELPLAKLEELLAKGEGDLVKFLKDETGKSDSALKKSLKLELDKHDAARFRTACQSDNALWKRVEPLAGLVRQDNFGYPVVIPKGSVFVTAGTDRRSSGTHYTPRSLTEPIVQYTLEPLVYVGPAEGKPKGEWKLKSAKELLEFKICDMACGSGAFLVQAARYMAERLLEAWDNAKKANPNTPGITPEGMPSTGKTNEALIPDDPAERKTYAMRIIAQRCLYGVDKNSLAAEMAKLSLWLLTLAKDKPFEFLDHSIRCGDSLVGLHSIDQLRHYSLKPDADDAVLFKGPLDSAVDEAITLRLKLEDMPANTVDDVQRQEKLLTEANEKIARLRCAADLLVAAEFWGESAKDKLERVRHAANQSVLYFEKGPTAEFEQVAAKERRGQTMFHWPLEFPEVIVKRGGFDAFVGNPPFMGGLKLETAFGTEWRAWLVHQLALGIRGVRGTADLCSYFFLRAFSLLSRQGSLGLIGTNTVSEGDSHQVGLNQIVEGGGTIIRAYKSIQWPGSASLQISVAWILSGEWNGTYWLDDNQVEGIASLLVRSDASQLAAPQPLVQNTNQSFIGSYVMGAGFLLTDDEVASLFNTDSKYKDVVKRYINGDDLNATVDQSGRRWVICFYDWPLTRTGANDKCAEDYPLALDIVRARVKPERDKIIGKNAMSTIRGTNWWRFAGDAKYLYLAIQGKDRVIAKALTSKHHAFAFVTTGQIFDQTLPVFAFDQYHRLMLLQSEMHRIWALEFGASLESRPRYTPSLCYGAFPFPLLCTQTQLQLDQIGERFDCFRKALMRERNEGLTKTYNRFHDPDESSADIRKLRELHVEMDQAVAAIYGWNDLDLDHNFHETKLGVRFTISEPTRREVLRLLLKLNHERYAEEEKQGLHGKKGAAKKAAQKKKAASIPAKGESTLFDMEDDE